MNNKHVADMLEIAPMSEPVAWMSANQKSFVHNLDIGDSVPNWTDYYTIPLYAAPQPCSRCEELLDKGAYYYGETIELKRKLAALEAENKRLIDQLQALSRTVMSDQVSNDSHSLFIAAIRDLAAINEALDLDPDDGGAVPIIDAIDELKATIAQQAATIQRLTNERDEYKSGWQDVSDRYRLLRDTINNTMENFK